MVGLVGGVITELLLASLAVTLDFASDSTFSITEALCSGVLGLELLRGSPKSGDLSSMAVDVLAWLELGRDDDEAGVLSRLYLAVEATTVDGESLESLRLLTIESPR